MLQTWQATVSTAAVRKYKVISVDLETGLQTQTLHLMESKNKNNGICTEPDGGVP